MLGERRECTLCRLSCLPESLIPNKCTVLTHLLQAPTVKGWRAPGTTAITSKEQHCCCSGVVTSQQQFLLSSLQSVTELILITSLSTYGIKLSTYFQESDLGTYLPHLLEIITDVRHDPFPVIDNLIPDSWKLCLTALL